MVGETLAADPAPIRPLRVYLAGRIALRGPDGTTVGERALAGRQGRRLLVRLAAIREPVAREELADDLWGTAWPPAWQVSLRALMSKLRAALARVGAAEAITSLDGTYALVLPAGAWVDLEEANRAIHRAETALSSGRLADAGGWALVARAIARRPLVPGEEGEWLDDLRRRLTDVRLRSLECLAETWIHCRDSALAARDAEEAIGIDPFRESAHRLLIRAHLASGQRGAAVRAYEACRRLLESELGIGPDPETVALVAGL